MPVFVILARARWGNSCVPLTQVRGGEERAMNVAQEIHRKYGMNRTVVLDNAFKVVFKIDRRCKCTNCQYEFNGKLVCLNCKRAISHEPVIVKEYQ